MTEGTADGGPIVTQADLGRELKARLRGPDGRRRKVGAVAARIDVSQSTLYAYLAGTTLPPTDVLDALMIELDVPAVDRRRLATARDALDRQRRRGMPAEPTAAPVPRELPADPVGFTGREAELAELDRALQAATDGGPAVAVVSGPAGVGKSALALHWAHSVAHGFSDGCVFADLRGFAPGEPRSASSVLAGFLHSLGVDAAEIPDDLDGREARWRSQAAGRRLLVVLDNGRDVEQVRPLLPGTGGCFVVVTSRNDLRALQVQPGAEPVVLAPLAERESLALLRAQLPAAHGEETGASRALTRTCAGLPLALRIVAAQVALRPGGPVDEVIEDLGDGLDMFDVGDESTSVRAVFSWSVDELPGGVARAFRLLGASPVTDLDLPGLAALLGVERRTARSHLNHLVRAHLVEQPESGRVRMHDLLREYAREQSAEHVTDDERAAAADRVVEHLTDVMMSATDVMHPGAEPADVADGTFTSVAAATAWVERAWDSLTQALQHTVDSGQPQATLRLVGLLQRHILHGESHYLDGEAVLRHGLAASRSLGDDAQTGHLLRSLGAVDLRLGRHDEARRWFEESLVVSREVGDSNGEAGALNNLGNAHLRAGLIEEAIGYYGQALGLARAHDMVRGQAICLSNLSVCHMRQADLDRAVEVCEEALALYHELDDRPGTARGHCILGEVARQSGEHQRAVDLLDLSLTEAREVGAVVIQVEALNTLGAVHRDVAAYDRALAGYAAALREARELGDGYEEARALEGMGEVWQATGEPARALAAWRDAVRGYGRLPEAERVRARLAEVDGADA